MRYRGITVTEGVELSVIGDIGVITEPMPITLITPYPTNFEF